MMHAAADTVSGPEVAAFIGMLVAAILLIGGGMATFLEFRKTKIMAGQEDALRQLVSRYEQLSEGSLDSQKRMAVEVSELLTRTAAIEQILRTVE
ncbi:MAG TPA: hypothetical protein VLL08_26940 [Kineosporiaceae bacterium]|nr:hypothetical protein [Kineosporiaceae bacterium]